MKIEISDELKKKLALSAIFAAEVKVSRESPGLWKEIADLSRIYRERFEGASPSTLPALAPARELYKACGVDPTKRRPASEALFRRVVRGKPLHKINSAVDCCNFCSLSFLLPIGLYDAAAIDEAGAVVRMGLEGEGYKGLGKDYVSLDGQILVADRSGPFGHPSADSFRTRVTENTRSLLWLIFAPLKYDKKALERHASFSMEWIGRACEGKATILPDAG